MHENMHMQNAHHIFLKALHVGCLIGFLKSSAHKLLKWPKRGGNN